MFERGGDQQSPDGGGATADGESTEEPRERLDDETVVHSVAARKPIRHEEESETEPLGEGADGEWALVLTDEAVHVVTTPPKTTVETVAYREVRSVDASSGVLHSTLAVRTWTRGTFHVAAGRGEPVGAAADFLERASDTHQRVAAALETARDHVTDLGQRIDAGDDDGTQAAHDAIRQQLSLARQRIDAGPDPVAGPLQDRVETVSTERQRTRMRAHVARGTDLAERGDRLTDAEAWDAAISAYRRAGDHYETARDAATIRGFDALGAIETAVENLQEQIERLTSLPLRLAEDAHQTARDADDREVAVPALAAALEHYRAALTAGWGTPVEFDGDPDVLRDRVERVASDLIAARRHLARDLRRTGDDRKMAGDHGAAADRYEAALDQLEAADRVAQELRAGDPDALADQRALVRERLAAATRAKDAEENPRDGGDDDGERDDAPTVDILSHKPPN